MKKKGWLLYFLCFVFLFGCEQNKDENLNINIDDGVSKEEAKLIVEQRFSKSSGTVVREPQDAFVDGRNVWIIGYSNPDDWSLTSCRVHIDMETGKEVNEICQH